MNVYMHECIIECIDEYMGKWIDQSFDRSFYSMAQHYPIIYFLF